MHHPVSHPLTDHAHSPAERLAAAEVLIDEVERASALAVHEINNALTNVLGRTQLLIRHQGRRPGVRAELHADLLAIDRASRDVARLTRQLYTDVVKPTRTYCDK